MQVKSQHKSAIRAKRNGSLRARSVEPASALDTILQIVREFEALPPETWKNTPRDLAKNVDHYLYGLPKEDDA
jgi:hypothetical protein